MATKGAALSLESLDIVSTTLTPDAATLTLTVTATPATWTHGFLDTLSLRQTADLVSGDLTTLSTSPTLSPDGTVTYTLPLNFTSPSTPDSIRFYFLDTAP